VIPVGPLIDVRRGEKRGLLLSFAACFGILAAHTVAETGRDALFLTHLPPARLPLAYLGIGVASLVFARLFRYLARRFGQRALLLGVVLLGAIMSVLFWLAFDKSRPWLFYAYYVWVGTFATTAVVELWLFASHLFTVGQGKRLFGLIAAGASLGTFAGAATAGLWSHWRPISQLPLVAAGLLVVTAITVLTVPAPPEAAPPVTAPPESTLKEVLGQHYLARVAALVAISSLVLMLVDYQFKATAAATVPPERLGAFLGGIYAALGVASLVAQAASARVVRRLGVWAALAALPFLLLGGATLAPVIGAFPAALVLRTSDGTLRHSLHRVGAELLYMPLAIETRERIKTFIDGAVARTAQAVASLLLLALATFNLSQQLLAPVIAAGACVWGVMAWSIRRPYIDRFIAALNPDGVKREWAMPPAPRRTRRDRRALVRSAIATARELLIYHAWRALLDRGQREVPERASRNGVLLRALLSDKIRLGGVRVFHLLAELHPRVRVVDVHEAITGGDERLRAVAFEVLENLLKRNLRDWIIALYDDLDDEARLQQVTLLLGPQPADYHALLARLAASDDLSLSTLAARHAEEIQEAPDAPVPTRWHSDCSH
jgi:MFS family permease